VPRTQGLLETQGRTRRKLQNQQKIEAPKGPKVSKESMTPRSLPLSTQKKQESFYLQAKRKE
jgi:hypothetical protein